jgi:hypothetical protein
MAGNQITGAESAETTPPETGHNAPAITDPKELDAEFGFSPEEGGREADNDHPGKDAKKPEGEEKDHPEGDKKPEGAEKPAGEGEKTPEEKGEGEEKLYAGKYKTPEDLEKAYSEIQTLQLKQAEGSKAEKENLEKEKKALLERIESYKDGKVVPGTGQDLLNQLIAKDPDNKANYEELYNSLGEEAFKAQYAITNSQLDALREETDKLREKGDLSDQAKLADDAYEKFIEKFPEAKDEKVKSAIFDITKEFLDDKNLNDPMFHMKTCLDIVKGRRSNEDFEKAVNAATDAKVDQIVKKQISEGLLVRRSAFTGGSSGKTEDQKELDREWGES